MPYDTDRAVDDGSERNGKENKELPLPKERKEDIISKFAIYMYYT